MKLTRREFVKTTAIGAMGLAAFKASLRNAYAFYQSSAIPLFVTKLRGAGAIGVALPDPFKAPVTRVTHYTLNINQFTDQIVPTLGKTTLWGYVPTIALGGPMQAAHLGGIIIAQKGVPIQITFLNNLPSDHILPVDTTQVYSDEGLRNRTSVHMHGGLVPWISDGGPFDWFSPTGVHGLSFLNNQVLNPTAPLNAAEYYYPMNQSARFMWYHDHAHGITRLNAYAGIASGLLIRDSFEANLINLGLPNYVEKNGNEIPLIFQDKIFVGTDLSTADPGYEGLKTSGSLWYAHTYEANQADGTGRWDLYPGASPVPEPSVVAEFFGDTMLVNGTTFPETTVEARRYRLRLLNACNARFLNLQLYVDDGSPNGITLNANGAPQNDPFINNATGNASFLQIGTEGGFLAKPVEVPSNVPLAFVVPPDVNTGQTNPAPSNLFKSLLVAPAERPDVIVDFTGYEGKSVILYSDAPAPFPSGDDRNDYFPGWNVGDGLFGMGNPVNGTTSDGYGPNTRVLMRFNVVPATGAADPPLAISKADMTKGIDRSLIDWGLSTPPKQVKTRFLTLNEYSDLNGRLIQILGNAAAPYGAPYAGPDSYYGYFGAAAGVLTNKEASSENVKKNAIEVWEIFNTTGDVHPMHFHLVNVQVINRQLFDVANLNFNNFLGDPIPPFDNEVGWKETVPMYPGTVTRIIMRFDMSKAQIITADGTNLETPSSPRTGGAEYVWHCHILEHEEHDMMHAMVVT